MSEENVHIPSPTDCSNEEFSEWLSKANLGYAYSVHNLLTASFEQLNIVRKDTMSKIQDKNGRNEDVEELTDFLKNKVYPMLHRIETRVFQCKDRIKEIEASGKPGAKT